MLGCQRFIMKHFEVTLFFGPRRIKHVWAVFLKDTGWVFVLVFHRQNFFKYKCVVWWPYPKNPLVAALLHASLWKKCLIKTLKDVPRTNGTFLVKSKSCHEWEFHTPYSLIKTKISYHSLSFNRLHLPSPIAWLPAFHNEIFWFFFENFCDMGRVK